MSRPPLEVADLIRSAGATFIERNRQWIRWQHVKVLLAIARCRTAALGGHVDQCTRCGHRATISYNRLPQSPLPEVSDGGTRSLDRRASKGASPDALRPCRLHTPCVISALDVTEQEAHLWPVAPGQRRNTSRSRL